MLDIVLSIVILLLCIVILLLINYMLNNTLFRYSSIDMHYNAYFYLIGKTTV